MTNRVFRHLDTALVDGLCEELEIKILTAMKNMSYDDIYDLAKFIFGEKNLKVIALGKALEDVYNN